MRSHLPVAAVLLVAGLAVAADQLPNPDRVIPDERNGWGVLVEAGKLIMSGDRDVYEPTYPDPWNPTRPGVVRYLAQNGPALAKLDEALAKPEPRRPANWYEQDYSAQSRPFAHWRELARLKSHRAHLRRAHGDLVGALRDCEDILTLAERLDQSGGLVMDYLVLRAVQAIALANAGLLMGPPPVGWEPARFPPCQQWPVPAYGPAERASLTAFARHVADESVCLPAVLSALSGEHRDFADWLKKANSELPVPLTDTEIEQLAEWRRQSTAAAGKYAALPAWQRPAQPTGPKAPAAVAKFGDVADMVADNSTLWHLARRLDADRARRRMSVVAIALRMYAGDHERLPATLADLVHEGYLTTVPLDPFTNGPIAYMPSRGLLYCLSEDQIDQGGQPWADCSARLDFVVTVGLKPPAPATEDWTDWIFERDLLDSMNDRQRPRHGWSVVR